MTREAQPTVFILIGRGFVARNVLRSGILDELRRRGSRVVILFNSLKGESLPPYLREEFENEQVHLEAVPPPHLGRLRRFVSRYTTLLVYNYKNRKIRYVRGKKSTHLLFLEAALLWPLSKLHVLKWLVRALERRFPIPKAYRSYFDRYQPDVVFSTSVISSFDMVFLREAKRRGVPTVGMPRGWDNIFSALYKVVPDMLIVQNKRMREDAVRFQRMKPRQVVVAGIPQFDWYRRADICMSREKLLAKYNIDPKRKLIFWGSTGVWTPDDYSIAELLTELVSKDKLVMSAHLFIRPYPMEAKTKRFDGLRDVKNVTVDDNFTLSDFFRDHVDPSIEETKLFTNVICHADLVITLCSTLTLDAFCADRPVINTAFKGFYDKGGRDISPILYTHDHYQPILQLGALDLVYDEEALVDSINRYLKHPERHHKERAKALDLACYKVDGHVSERVVDAVLSIA